MAGLINRRPEVLVVLAYSLVSLAIGLGVHGFVAEGRERTIEEEGRSLGIVADLKVSQIVRWRGERLDLAGAISANAMVARRVREYLAQPSHERIPEDLAAWMAFYVAVDEFTRVDLYDPAGQFAGASEGTWSETEDRLRAELRTVARTGKPLLSDLYESGVEGGVELYVIAPLIAPGEGGGSDTVTGFVVLHLDPARFLFPYLQKWPTPSRSAETLLVRREGDEVTYLNDLRNGQGTARILRRPLGNDQLPAAQAARGVEGQFLGVDYRGGQVLSQLRSVPGTGWKLVAKKDLEEVLESTRREAFKIYGMAAGLIVLLGLALLYGRKLGQVRNLQRALRSEHALRASETRLRLVLDSIAEGLYGIDLDGKCTFCNAAGLRLLGYGSEADVLGRNMHDLIHHARADGSALPAEECRIFQAFQKGECSHLEDEVFWRADGTCFPVEYRSYPKRIGDQVAGAVVTFVDITLRKKDEAVQAARVELLERFSAGDSLEALVRSTMSCVERLFPGHPSSILLLDDSGRLHNAASSGLPEFYNAAIEGLEIGPGVGSCGAAAHSARRVVVEDIATHPNWAPFVDLARRAELGACWSEPIRTDGGGVLGTVAVYSRHAQAPDVADLRTLESVAALTARLIERKRADEALRSAGEEYQTIIQTANDGFWLTDFQARFLDVNEAACRMLGYTRAELLRMGIADVEAVESPEETARHAESLAQRGRDQFESRHRRKDGIVIDVEVNVQFGNSRGGCLAVFVRDITGSKRAETALREATAAAEAGNRAKSEFLSRMSHELRTPLNAVLGFAQLLELDVSTPEQKDGVARILESGRHLLDLINDVLDMARVDIGRVSLVVENVSVCEQASAAIQMTRLLAQAKSVAVVCVGGCTARYRVRADARRLRQVILNLVSNAIKYNREGGSVTIECERVDGRVRLNVQDTGLGLTPEQIGRLFRPFERVGAEARGVEGTGLGLALSRGLAEAMGGTMGVESVVGQGSTFWLELPLAEVATVEQGHAADEVVHPRIGPGPRVVLQIEDNAANRELVEQALAADLGLAVRSEATGLAGLEAIRLHRPDLVLLDAQLPDVSGLEVLHRLRAEPATRDLPVLALTADASPDVRAAFLAAGANQLMTKPLDLLRFRDLVATILERTGGRDG